MGYIIFTKKTFFLVSLKKLSDLLLIYLIFLFFHWWCPVQQLILTSVETNLLEPMSSSTTCEFLGFRLLCALPSVKPLTYLRPLCAFVRCARIH